MSKSSASPELQALAEQIGEFIAYWGFKRVHGRLWTHLYLSAHPMDAAEFMDRLGISKALVSMTLSDLLKFEVIRPAGKSPRGTDLFEANPDTTQVILNVIRSREKRMLARIEEAFQKFKKTPDKDNTKIHLSAERQESMGKLIGSAQAAVDGILNLTSVELQAWRELSAALLPNER